VVARDVATAREAIVAAGAVGAFIERALKSARHVVVMVVGDGDGSAVHVGEHESSVRGPGGAQMRECPSPGLNPADREKLCMAAADFLAAWRFLGVGAVRFLVGPDGRPWFSDVDAGLAEGFALHDMVYGTDLVGAQISLAAGEELGWDQEEMAPDGHAVEIVVSALSKGTLTRFDFPDAPGLDAVATVGTLIDPAVDPVLARIRARAPTRHAALVRVRAALAVAKVSGVETDIEACALRLADRGVWDGDTASRVIDRPEG
jgi:acetyl/propionyl-CoA carboxylase alpha subunit